MLNERQRVARLINSIRIITMIDSLPHSMVCKDIENMIIRTAEGNSDKSSKGGFYIIVGNNGEYIRIYGGKTQSFERRFREHKNDLVNGKHCNKFMQNFYNKYEPSVNIFGSRDSTMQYHNSANTLIFYRIAYSNDKELLKNMEQEFLNLFFECIPDSYKRRLIFNINPYSYEWWNSKKEIEDLADEYGVNCAVILNIIKNETYTDSGWEKKLPEIKDKLKKDASRKMSEKRSGEDSPNSQMNGGTAKRK
jgi:hypothetical protein